MPKAEYRPALTQEEREELEAIVTKGKHNAQKVLNALILLNCDEDAPSPRTLREKDIADVLKVSAMKLHRVKQRFVEEGLEVALYGQKGRRIYEKKADGEFEAHLVALSCGSPPQGHARWGLSPQKSRLGRITGTRRTPRSTGNLRPGMHGSN